MKPGYRFVVIIFFLISFLNINAATIAVLDFTNNSLFDAENYDNLSKGLAEMIITEFSEVQSVNVVERRDLKAVMDEIKLSQTGMIEANKTVEAGKLLGAKHLVLGGFVVSMNDEIRIDLRIIEVETGLTKHAAEVTGKTKKIFGLIQELSTKVIADLDIKLSQDDKKALKKSKNLDIKALMLFSEGLDFEDAKMYKKAMAKYYNALKIEPEFKRAKVRLARLMKIEKEKQ